MIAKLLIDRGIKLCNIEEEKHVKTVNKTVMDYVIECIEDKNRRPYNCTD